MKTPLKSIREKCLECCVHQVGEVKKCTADDCSLYPFRLGKNPNRQAINRAKVVLSKNTASISDLAP